MPKYTNTTTIKLRFRLMALNELHARNEKKMLKLQRANNHIEQEVKEIKQVLRQRSDADK